MNQGIDPLQEMAIICKAVQSPRQPPTPIYLGGWSCDYNEERVGF